MTDQLRSNTEQQQQQQRRTRLSSMYESGASNSGQLPQPPNRSRLNSTTGAVASQPPSNTARARTMSSASRSSNLGQPEYTGDRTYATLGSRNQQPLSTLSSSSSSSRRTSWAPHKLSQAATPSLADFDPTTTATPSSSASRPATGSRIPSFGRSTSSHPRLGDSLLGQRKTSDSNSRSHAALASSASSSSLTFPARSDSLNRSTRLTSTAASAASSASISSLASISRSTSGSMGPPSSTSHSALLNHPRNPSHSSYSNNRTQPRISPSLPDFGSSFGSALFDDPSNELPTTAELDESDTDTRTPLATSAPFAPAPPSSSSTTTTRPHNLHLGLRESPSLSSRFSNFSSAIATPEASDDPSKMLGRIPSGASLPSRSARSDTQQPA